MDIRGIGTAAVLATALHAHAATIHVDDDAPNDPGPGDPTVSDPLEDGSAAHPFDAIQKAIDASGNGDVIFVHEGTYVGVGNRDIDYGGRAITVQGEGTDLVVVDLLNTPDGFVFDDGETAAARLESLTVRHGAGAVGGPALRCTNGSAPTIDGCAFESCSVEDDHGGAVWLGAGSDVAFANCRFAGNEVREGTGLVDDLFGGAIYAQDCHPTFEACEFTANLADSEAIRSYGGAVALDQATADFDDCTFTDNAAGTFGDSGRGGAIHATGQPIEIRDCAFVRNNAEGSCSGEGGAVFGDAPGSVVTGCTFDDNLARGFTCVGYSLAIGGALALSQATIEDCRFEDNRALSLTKGKSNTGAGGAAQAVNTFRRCVFAGNRASLGGAIGHGFPAPKGEVLVVNCLFVANEALHQNNDGPALGGAIRSQAPGSILNSTFVGNTGEDWEDPAEGGAIRSNDMLAVRNCIFRDNVPDQLDGPTDVTYSNVQGGALGVGNIDVDPLFVDAANDDYRLGAGSPSIDAGTNTVDAGTIDLDGAPRYVDDPDTPDTGEETAPIVDMGAYEFQVACDGDVDGSGAVDFQDLLQVLSDWGPCPGCPSDVDGNDVVDFQDLLVVLSSWGDC